MKSKIVLSISCALLILLILFNIYLSQSIPWDKFVAKEQLTINSKIADDNRNTIILLCVMLIVPLISLMLHLDEKKSLSWRKIFPPWVIITMAVFIAAAATANIWTTASLRVINSLQGTSDGNNGLFTGFVLMPAYSLGLLILNFIAWLAALLGISWAVYPRNEQK